MEWHVERLETKFLIETKFLEPEEVLVDIFREIATNKLLAAIVERTSTVCASILGKSRPLWYMSKDVSR